MMEHKIITKEELQEILAKHILWINCKEGGERANLSGADLRGVDLRGANLRGADLRGVDLRGANLFGADLRGVDLRGANLSGANLFEADLGGADLFEADLRGVDLRGANLSGADLFGAFGKIISIGPIGSRRGITYAFWCESDKNIHIKCGCFSGSFDAWVNKCAETHGGGAHGKNYAAVAELIKTVAKNNGWGNEV